MPTSCWSTSWSGTSSLRSGVFLDVGKRSEKEIRALMVFGTACVVLNSRGESLCRHLPGHAAHPRRECLPVRRGRVSKQKCISISMPIPSHSSPPHRVTERPGQVDEVLEANSSLQQAHRVGGDRPSKRFGRQTCMAICPCSQQSCRLLCLMSSNESASWR